MQKNSHELHPAVDYTLRKKGLKLHDDYHDRVMHFPIVQEPIV